MIGKIKKFKNLSKFKIQFQYFISRKKFPKISIFQKESGKITGGKRNPETRILNFQGIYEEIQIKWFH